jgi:hypothetical protein
MFLAFCSMAPSFSQPVEKGTAIQAETFNPDFDGDGTVDSKDLLDFLDHSGPVKGESDYQIRYDLNNDDRIDDLDLVVFIDSWKRDVAPRTPISPDLLRTKLGIFEFEPKDPDDTDPLLDPEVYSFDSVTLNEGGDPLQNSLPAIVSVGAATGDDGRAIYPLLITKETGLGPYVAVLSATGPIMLDRFELLGQVPVDVPTGSVFLQPQPFLLSQPMSLTPPDQVISGHTTISMASVEVEVTVDSSKAGYIGWPLVKGATITMAMVIPVTAETTLFDLSNQGDWSQTLSCLRFRADVPVNGVVKGVPLGTGVQVGSVDVFFGVVDGPKYLRASSAIAGMARGRQYRRTGYTQGGCYKETHFEPNNSEQEAPSIPLAGIVCVKRAGMSTKAPNHDIADWFSIVPAFEGDVEVTFTLKGYNDPSTTAATLVLTQGGNTIQDFVLDPPTGGARINARTFSVPVHSNDPILIALSIPDQPEIFAGYVLFLRYTRFEVNCVSEVEPNDNDAQAQVLMGTGCVSGQVDGGADLMDTFRIEADAEKTAQLLLNYKVTGGVGTARLLDSTGAIVESRVIQKTSQSAFYAQFGASDPLTFFVSTSGDTRIEYSLAYSVTDGGGGNGGACRDESPANTSQAQAFAINPPDCVNGLIHPATKIESWFAYQPTEPGVFHALCDLTPLDGSFQGYFEVRGNNPSALPISFAGFSFPGGLFPLFARLNGGVPYFVRFLSGGNGRAQTSTQYRFAPDACQEELQPNGNNTAQLAESFGSASCVSGFVAQGGDSADYFQYTEPVGGILRFLILGSSFSSPNSNTVVSLYDAASPGVVVDTAFASPSSASFLSTNAAPNSQWIIGLVSSFADLDYTVRALPPMTCSTETGQNDSPITASLINTASCIQGDIRVTPGDTVDYYRVRCDNAGTLRIVVVSNDHSNTGFAEAEFQDQSLRLIQLSNFSADFGGVSFDIGALAGEEFLVCVTHPSDPFLYELRVDVP